MAVPGDPRGPNQSDAGSLFVATTGRLTHSSRHPQSRSLGNWTRSERAWKRLDKRGAVPRCVALSIRRPNLWTRVG